jgi:hypothetical protein
MRLMYPSSDSHLEVTKHATFHNAPRNQVFDCSSRAPSYRMHLQLSVGRSVLGFRPFFVRAIYQIGIK